MYIVSNIVAAAAAAASGDNHGQFT